MRIQSANAPRLGISPGMARLGMLMVYLARRENQRAQVYGSRSHCSLDRSLPRTISIPAKVSSGRLICCLTILTT